MLVDGTVDIWWVRLADVRDPRADLLTAAERGRYDGYLRDDDKRRFAAGSAVVRLAFAGYVGMSAPDVPLDRSCPDCGRPHGRIRLPERYGLHVSVSHSGDWVGVAFARAPVGLDVESVSRNVDVDSVGRLALDDAEALLVKALPAEQRAAAFTRYWARKEAVLKATGEGLRTTPSLVHVSAPDEPPRLLAHAHRPDLPGALTLRDTDPDAGHRAAVAVLGTAPIQVNRRDGMSLLWRTP